MALELDVDSAGRRDRLRLDADRVTVGKADENDVALADDGAVSHMHALLERFPAGWLVSDLGSTNGTWVNGDRIWSPQRLREGDEVRVGQTRLTVRRVAADDVASGARTDVEAEPPTITPRERDVLIALCRPLLARDMFTEPAATRAIAEDLVVTQAAVKQHLANLYDKFGVAEHDANRRVRLANEALRRGAVSVRDLHHSDPG